MTTKPVLNKRKNRFSAAMLIAGALVASTALTSLTTMLPTQPAVAETVLNKAPKQGFADLVEKVMPTVVSVKVRFATASAGQGFTPNKKGLPGHKFNPQNPFEFFFDQFPQRGFGPKFPQRRGGQAVGSGFIISADGYVVTNNHVVKDASTVKVTLSDGNEYDAKVVGTDPKTDLAVLKISANKTFKFAKLADKDPRVGDWVVAVGNPFGLGGTVTTGIVSAKGRNIGSGPYDNFLQIDASINKGNSGGPAFNLKGEVIGVNTAIFSPSGGSVGIGFAIPASTTKQIVKSLIDNGSVTRGWLGVQIQTITKDIAESMGLTPKHGALIANVNNGSPAAKAGLKTGDTIMQVNGADVKGPQDLARKIAMVTPGSTVKMTIIRKGKRQTLNVKIGKMPGTGKLAGIQSHQAGKTADLAQLGIAVKPADDGAGLVVGAVDPQGKAAEKGIRPGDVIVEVGGIEVNDPASMKAALKRVAKSGDRKVLMLVRSGDRQRYVALPLG